ASSCVQVGPDCTCVKSRTLTPWSARPAWPHGLVDGRGTPLPFGAFAAGFFAVLSFTTFFTGFFAAAFDLALAFFLVAMGSSFFVMPERASIQCTPIVRRPG